MEGSSQADCGCGDASGSERQDTCPLSVALRADECTKDWNEHEFALKEHLRKANTADVPQFCIASFQPAVSLKKKNNTASQGRLRASGEPPGHPGPHLDPLPPVLSTALMETTNSSALHLHQLLSSPPGQARPGQASPAQHWPNGWQATTGEHMHVRT